jgi:hypothetical protein
MNGAKIHYRARPQSKIREETIPVLEKHVQPIPKIADLPAIVPEVGRPPSILKDWVTDKRTANFKKYVLDGLMPKESAILAGFADEEYENLMKRADAFRRFVERALIEFKQKHLKVITDKSDPKTSQWLLEQMFPEQYAQKKSVVPPGEGGSSTTVIQAIVKTVQSTPDSPVPVQYEYANTSTEEKSDDRQPQDDSRPEPSLDGGGANII